jgi:hypothetical protein
MQIWRIVNIFHENGAYGIKYLDKQSFSSEKMVEAKQKVLTYTRDITRRINSKKLVVEVSRTLSGEDAEVARFAYMARRGRSPDDLYTIIIGEDEEKKKPEGWVGAYVKWVHTAHVELEQSDNLMNDLRRRADEEVNKLYNNNWLKKMLLRNDRNAKNKKITVSVASPINVSMDSFVYYADIERYINSKELRISTRKPTDQELTLIKLKLGKSLENPFVLTIEEHNGLRVTLFGLDCRDPYKVFIELKPNESIKDAIERKINEIYNGNRFKRILLRTEKQKISD